MQILQKILIVTAVVCWSKCFEHSTTFNKALHSDIDYTTLPVKTTIAPATFRGFISFDKNQLTSRRPPVCQCDQYYSIYTNTCKKKQYHTCGKMSQAPTSSSLTISPKAELLPKIYMFPYMLDCVKLTGGVVIDVSRTSKNLEHMQTNQAVVLGNYTFSFLSYQKLYEVHKCFKFRNKSIILVPYKVFPYTKLYGFSPQRHFLHNRVCADPKIIDKSFEVTRDCNSNVTIYNITKDVTYWINITNGMITFTSARCERFHLEPNCMIGVLNASWVVKKNNSITVRINGEESCYTPEQYLPLAEGLGICYEMNGIKEYQWLRQFYYIEDILTLIILFFSIILEFLLLVCRSSKNRNVADKNLTSLSCTLLLCDIPALILSLGNEHINGMPSKVIAIWLHFFSLALCTWSCIIAYEIWSIFRARNIARRLNYLYLRYSVVAWGIPILVISICLTVDVLSKESLISYGKQNYCWIFPAYARITVYIVPISVMNFGSSLIVFMSMLRAKHERTEINKKVAKNGRMHYSKMIMRLSLLLGTAELVGLVQIPNAKEQSVLIINVTFGFLYKFLRSSRGIFMFVLFGLNGLCKKCRKCAERYS